MMASTNAHMNGKRPGGEEESARGDGSGRAASSDKRQKIAKKNSTKKDEADVEPEDGILPLRLTTHSGFLPLKDAGRFLLMVSKGMAASIYEDRVSLDADAFGGNGGDETADDGEDELPRLRQSKVRNEVWKTLCEIKWRRPKVLKHLASTLGGDGDDVDWERLCRKFLPQPAQPVVRASVDDYSFILSLFDCPRDEKDFATPISTCILEGEKAANFLKMGRTDFLKLDEPVKIGNYASKKSAVEHCDLSDGPLAGIFSTLHAIRKSDGKSCELDTQGNLYIFDEEEDRGIYGFSWSEILEIGKLHMLVGPELEVATDLSIQRNLQAVAKDAGNGRVDYCITHVDFAALVICNENQVDSMKEGVTYADFLELLEGWK